VQVFPHPFEIGLRCRRGMTRLLPEQEEAVVVQEALGAMACLGLVDRAADGTGKVVRTLLDVVEKAHGFS